MWDSQVYFKLKINYTKSTKSFYQTGHILSVQTHLHPSDYRKSPTEIASCIAHNLSNWFCKGKHYIKLHYQCAHAFSESKNKPFIRPF